MADELQAGIEGLEVKLVEGSSGVFDVSTNGSVIFSKKSVGRFPNPGEVLGLMSG